MSTKDDSAALAVLGLGPAEQAAYELLVERSPAHLRELAEVWTRSEDLPLVLSTLEELGMVSAASRPPGKDVRYAAIAPTMALRSLLLDNMERLEATRRHVSVLEAAYRARPVGHEESTPVEVVTGARAVRQRLIQLHRWARHQVRSLDRYPHLDASGDAGGEGRPDRDLVQRTVYDRSSLNHPGALVAVERRIRTGEQARILPQLALTLHLADDRLAVLPVTETTALVVRPSALLDALITLFEGFWQRAVPLRSPVDLSASSERSTADAQRLVTLLLSGVTDAAIARQLGLSYRTVQRHVAALMAEMGTHTRFQAGVQAALRERNHSRGSSAA
ncbi:MAG TPA: LuxR C-terminal-related transcriptional regulator [Candidatus Limnocylindrales bacterium]